MRVTSTSSIADTFKSVFFVLPHVNARYNSLSLSSRTALSHVDSGRGAVDKAHHLAKDVPVAPSSRTTPRLRAFKSGGTMT
eukprot:scaffold198540_cov29-Tisochrysis_lutea.AAC.1